jgi:hypothetical protein
MKIDFIIQNVAAVIVDGEYITFPATNENDTEIHISRDWENGDVEVIFNEESFENAISSGHGNIVLKDTKGDEYELTLLTEIGDYFIERANGELK